MIKRKTDSKPPFQWTEPTLYTVSQFLKDTNTEVSAKGIAFYCFMNEDCQKTLDQIEDFAFDLVEGGFATHRKAHGINWFYAN